MFAPRLGFEPRTLFLTGIRSTAELPGNIKEQLQILIDCLQKSNKIRNVIIPALILLR